MDAMPCPAAMAVRVEGICLRVRRGQAFKAAAARCSAPLALPLRSFGVKRHEQRKSSFPGSFIIISSAFAKKKKKKKKKGVKEFKNAAAFCVETFKKDAGSHNYKP